MKAKLEMEMPKSCTWCGFKRVDIPRDYDRDDCPPWMIDYTCRISGQDISKYNGYYATERHPLCPLTIIEEGGHQ